MTKNYYPKTNCKRFGMDSKTTLNTSIINDIHILYVLVTKHKVGYTVTVFQWFCLSIELTVLFSK